MSGRAASLEKLAQVSVVSGLASLVTFYVMDSIASLFWLSPIFSIVGILTGIVVLFHPASGRITKFWGILGIVVSAPAIPFLFASM